MTADGDFDEYMDAVYSSLRYGSRERAFHNRDGFFADPAGSDKCVELGHREPLSDWSEREDDLHPRGFDGELLCLGTRHGQCCTECEGECGAPEWLLMSTPGELWALVAVGAA